MYQLGTRSSLVLATLVAISAGCSSGRSEPKTAPSPGAGATEPARCHGGSRSRMSWERAVSRGTRTHTGEPGPKYWQQWADYRLEAELNPVSKRLTGKGTVTYQNRSPDTLQEVYVQLLHNIFAPGCAA